MVETTVRTCARCGDGFPSRGTGGNARSYCLPCERIARKLNLLSKLGVERQCSKCQQRFTPTYATSNGVTWCRSCRTSSDRQHVARQCSCGASISKGRRRCDACKRENRRSAERRKDLLRRGLNVPFESYDIHEIAERDGWLCHLCGKKVPNRQYASRDADPTIDHLIPVSAGGHDVKSNVALAHNRCNWERGAGGVAQLRLIG